jgi:RHS repeat-associated protein
MYRTRNLPFFVSKSAWHSDVNALGSNIVLTDDDQNVIVRYEYDVFGAIRSEVGTSDNPRKFTGKEYESDVRLYYFAARYYDPYIGRFITRDPAGDGLNWYIYTENNPLKYIDPSGMILLTPTTASGIGYFERTSIYYSNGGFYVGAGGAWHHISLEQATSALADFTPIIGDAKGFLEGIIGRDLLTGDSYSPIDRFLSIIFLTEVRGLKKGAQYGLDALGAAIDAGGGLSKIGRKGKSPGIREVVGTESDAKNLFDLLRGDNPIEDAFDRKGNKTGIKARSKDVPGKWVTFRTTSTTGEQGPVVDVHGIEGKLKKIKFVKE